MSRLWIALRSIVYAALFLAAWGTVALMCRAVDKYIPLRVPGWLFAPGVALFLAGAALALTTIGFFIFEGRGTPAVFDPPRRFVPHGPYRLVRNPMYIGGVSMLLGWGFYLTSISMVLLCVGCVPSYSHLRRLRRRTRPAKEIRTGVRGLLQNRAALDSSLCPGGCSHLAGGNRGISPGIKWIADFKKGDNMRVVIASIEAEYQRYKQMAEAAFRQLSDEQLAQVAGASENSVATIAWHIGGNLRSRFTDFLDADGEKPWRDRETESLPRHVTHAELLAFWEQGWQALSTALASLTDTDLTRAVKIRNQTLSVVEALHRSLAHTSCHVGQIVFARQDVVRLRLAIPEHTPGQISGI